MFQVRCIGAENLQSIVDLSRLADLFTTTPDVGYIGVVGKNDKVLFSKSRDTAMTSVQPDDEVISVYPPLVMRAVERLEPMLGAAQSVVVTYGKSLLALYRVPDYLVVVNIKLTPVAPLLAIKVGDEIRNLLK